MAKKIGWVSELRRYAASTQRKALTDAGVSEALIYDGDMRDMLNDATRGGVLYVHRLATLGHDRAGWRRFIEQLGGRALKIVEVSTGFRFDMPADLAEAIAGMTDDWASNKLTAAQAKNFGKRGATKRWGKIERTAIRTAAPIWKNWWDYPTPEDALAHPDMAGWTESTAKLRIGKRGAPPGPISAREKP